MPAAACRVREGGYGARFREAAWRAGPRFPAPDRARLANLDRGALVSPAGRRRPGCRKSAQERRPPVQAPASQAPFSTAQPAVQIGYDIVNGEKPDDPTVLTPSALVTKGNAADHEGWSFSR
jgi:hypothetical protein